MSEYFPVVKVLPDWRDDEEDMGSKEKFWYRELADDTPWLFKHPRENTGEHWAEKIASEVAGLLEVPHARVELAEYEGHQGSTTESFRDDWTMLIHGNQILGGMVPGYEQDRRRRQYRHTLSNIVGYGASFLQDDLGRERFIQRLCGYLVFDAVIGNTDRHHENWGLLHRIPTSATELSYPTFDLAPTYDHGSSLGRELSDAQRARILSEGTVGRYSKRGGNGRGVYWSETDGKPPSPLELVRVAALEYPDMFLPALKRVKSLEIEAVDQVVKRVPPGWMSEVSQEFAVALMDYNCKQLNLLLDDAGR